MNRGVIRKASARLVNLWVPNTLLPSLDQGVRNLDLDRSKFVRHAICEKLARSGVELPDEFKEMVKSVLRPNCNPNPRPCLPTLSN